MKDAELTPREIIVALVEKLKTQVAVSEALFVTEGMVSRWLSDPTKGMGRQGRELARQVLEGERNVVVEKG